MSCMLACSLVHEGGTNPSLSRIQVIQNPFLKWPDDLTIEQCRQCLEPACVEACPFKPSRAIWNFQGGHAQKCDLCSGAPYWDAPGGPKGRQACVEICPVGAIQFTSEIPEQKGDRGYKVDLKEKAWQWLGYSKK